MGDKQTISSLVTGGEASAGPPLGPALGPLGVNIMEVIAKINEKTGVELVEEWLREHDMYKFVEKVVWGKPNAKFYIDDKGIRFTNWKQTLEDMENYERL